jgi:hypothetical protein
MIVWVVNYMTLHFHEAENLKSHNYVILFNKKYQIVFSKLKS